MGRLNRSRKRKNKMDRVKRERNAKKELARLKKTLGIIDDADMKDGETVTIKTAAQLKKEKMEKEEAQILAEIADENDPGEIVKVVNEKTQKVHLYNTKTMRDQFGKYPSWKRPRKTAKKQRKQKFALIQNYKHSWSSQFVPLE